MEKLICAEFKSSKHHSWVAKDEEYKIILRLTTAPFGLE
jgi:hypothetical protein